MHPRRTEQNRTEQNRTEQNRTEQNRTEQNRTEQNRTAICSESASRIILLPASLPHPGGNLACGESKTVRAAFFWFVKGGSDYFRYSLKSKIAGSAALGNICAHPGFRVGKGDCCAAVSVLLSLVPVCLPYLVQECAPNARSTSKYFVRLSIRGTGAVVEAAKFL
jgi:hypothetical protein